MVRSLSSSTCIIAKSDIGKQYNIHVAIGYPLSHDENVAHLQLFMQLCPNMPMKGKSVGNHHAQPMMNINLEFKLQTLYFPSPLEHVNRSLECLGGRKIDIERYTVQ